MKDLFSAFGAAVFHPLVSLVLPGLTGISCWFIYLMNLTQFRLMISRNHSETAFVLMLASIFLGTIIDDLGIRLEGEWLDRVRNARTKGKHEEEWWAYLSKPFEIEPSGRRHLRRLVARLKFELGIPIGLLLTCPAVWLDQNISLSSALVITATSALLFWYLLTEATATHDVLGELRHQLLRDGRESSLSRVA